jgi:hypothetical protein
MISELALSLSANLFEPFIDLAWLITRQTALNISANGPSRVPADEFECFNTGEATGRNVGGAGYPAAEAVSRPFATPPLVDLKIWKPDNCVVTVWPTAARSTLASTHH